MNIAIIDADINSGGKNKFPNLALMKLSAYHKANGHDVTLKLDYDNLDAYDKLLIGKVFTDTEVPSSVYLHDNVEIGGTGFFYDKAPKLPDEIEHHMPDYTFYNPYVAMKKAKGVKDAHMSSFTSTSIGFTTRGCFRKCSFCVNKNSSKVVKHSPLSEFYDPSRKTITLLDDNVFGYHGWKDIFQELQETKKPFCFKQGLDIRIMNEEKALALLHSKYSDAVIFAFDNIEDCKKIEQKLYMWRSIYPKRTPNTMIYTFCGYDRNEKYDDAFWKQDAIDLLERFKVCVKYNCAPYVMRHKNWRLAPKIFQSFYISMAGWANQHFCFNQTIMEYANNAISSGATAQGQHIKDFAAVYPGIANEYFGVKMLKSSEFRTAIANGTIADPSLPGV